MLKIKVFLNEPRGLTWKRLQEIMPRLEQKYTFNLGTVTRSREEFQGEEYKASGLPAAPAVMVDNEIAARGPTISEEGLEVVIRKHLGLPPLEPERNHGIKGEPKC